MLMDEIEKIIMKKNCQEKNNSNKKIIIRPNKKKNQGKWNYKKNHN